MAVERSAAFLVIGNDDLTPILLKNVNGIRIDVREGQVLNATGENADSIADPGCWMLDTGSLILDVDCRLWTMDRLVSQWGEMIANSWRERFQFSQLFWGETQESGFSDDGLKTGFLIQPKQTAEETESGA
jgi:hypothetical protein